MKKIMYVIIWFCLLWPLAILQGWVGSKLWNWFCADVFNYVVSIPQMIGLTIVFRFVNLKPVKQDKKSLGEVTEGMITWAYAVMFSLLLGYIVKQFI